MTNNREVVLDLDELIENRPKIKYKGTVYVMKTVTVREFIEATKQAQSLDAKENSEESMSTEEMVNGLVDMVFRFFPEVGKEKLQDMGMVQLQAIMELCMDSNTKEAGDEAKKK